MRDALDAWRSDCERLMRSDVTGEVVARWRNWGAMQRLGCSQGGSVGLGDWCKMLKMRIFFFFLLLGNGKIDE